jgi:hypothetical protein
MSKFTDLLKTALTKKKGHQHVEHDDSQTTGNTKVKPQSAPVKANKPQKKVTGRGR